MKKIDLYNIWKIDYWLDEFSLERIILKNLNISKNNLFLLQEIENISGILADFEKYKSWYPIEYILKEAEFYWLNFFVDNRVLIPRNDTEILVSQVLEEITPPTHSELLPQMRGTEGEFILIDVWTWSSCIPISILKNLKYLPKKTYVIDVSKEALEVSKINIEKHNLQDKIIQIESDLLSAFTLTAHSELPPHIRGIEGELNKVSTLIITANLPYIKNEDYENMDNWVFFFEPNIALFGWKETWFELYEKLINQIFEMKEIYKIEKITLFIEIWFDQLKYSRKYLENFNLHFEYFKDMNNIERTIKITF